MNALAEFLRDAPFFVFAFAFAIPALIAGGALYAAFWSWRNARALAAAEPVMVADLSEGRRLAQGHVDANEAASAPLTGRRCAWWELKVEESVRSERRDSSGHYDHHWRTLREERSKRPLKIVDGQASCLVDSAGAIVYPTAWSEWYGADREPRPSEPELHPGTETPGGSGRIEIHGAPDQRYRYLERYIWAGDPLFALGDVRRAKSGFRLSKPAGNAPFIVSTRSPDDIREQSGLAVQGGLIVGVIFAGLAAAAAMLKFG